MGQLLASLAVAAAFVLAWGAAQGDLLTNAEAPLWQRVLHSALLGERMRPPATFGLDSVGVFLVCASVLLAIVALLQLRQVVAIIVALALALLSRGAFDSPLRAIAVVAAAQWIAVAAGDDRAMWRSLLDQRNRKLSAPPSTPAPPPAEPEPKGETVARDENVGGV